MFFFCFPGGRRVQGPLPTGRLQAGRPDQTEEVPVPRGGELQAPLHRRHAAPLRRGLALSQAQAARRDAAAQERRPQREEQGLPDAPARRHGSLALRRHGHTARPQRQGQRPRRPRTDRVAQV